MRIYRIRLYDLGGTGRYRGIGMRFVARTNQAEALRQYALLKKEYVALGGRFRLDLDLVETPVMTAELWIEFIENGDIALDVIKSLRSERFNGAKAA